MNRLASFAAIALVISSWTSQPASAASPLVQQAYVKPPVSSSSSFGFGYSVAIDGNTAVIGASGVRAAFVFERAGGVWAQQATLPVVGLGLGMSVAISGDRVVVGMPGESASPGGPTGAAYVYVRSGSSWSQEAFLKASNPDISDYFGWSVGISGDTVVVGAYGEDSCATGVNGDQGNNGCLGAGAAYVFARDGAQWSQQAYLKASNTQAADQFAYSVAIDGERIVVGAYGEDSSASGVNGNQNDNSAFTSGAAYVYLRQAGVWSQDAYLKASNPGPGDQFGTAAAISGELIAIGAIAEDSDATGVNGDQGSGGAVDSGAAYVFRSVGGAWTQEAYLKASNTGGGDLFGSSVSVSGDSIVVGAYREDSGSSGVNGDQANNSAADSGAAYVFVREEGTWLQPSYLKASNTGADDRFGSAVGISGGTVVVGAFQEDSNAIGIDGDQSNDLANGSGAAYIFVTAPTPACTLDLSLSYAPNILTSHWTLGIGQPATWAALLFGSFGQVPLWNVSVPAIDPPADFSIPLNLPPTGDVLMLSLLYQSNVVLCFDYALASTGGSLTGPTMSELQSIAEKTMGELVR